MTTQVQTRPTFGPYSPIRQAETLYFVSGQVGINPDTGNAPADVAEQTKFALENMSRILSTNGLSLANVVKTIIFVTNMKNFEVVNEVYSTYFDEPRPARSTVGVAELPRVGGDNPVLVEIEAIAYKDTASSDE